MLMSLDVDLDPEVEKAHLKYSKQVKEKAGMKVGKSLTFLEADDKTCRLRECNFGNLVTDALIDLVSRIVISYRVSRV